MKNFNFKKGILLFIFALGFFLLPAIGVEAADDKTFDFIPQVGIPGSDFEKGKTAEMEKGTTKPIAVYIKAIYTWAIGFIGVLAAVVLMIGGVIWLTAGGNNNKVETAKQWIGGALTGLVLALGSYLLLYQINPDLVEFKVVDIATVEFEGKKIKDEPRYECQWKEVAGNENCIDVLGQGWIDKDSNFCEGDEPDMRCCCMDKVKIKQEDCIEKCGSLAFIIRKGECLCEGSGTHKVCRKVDSLSNETQYQCAISNYPGEDECSDASDCRGNESGCCLTNRQYFPLYGWEECSQTTRSDCPNDGQFYPNSSCGNYWGNLMVCE